MDKFNFYSEILNEIIYDLETSRENINLWNYPEKITKTYKKLRRKFDSECKEFEEQLKNINWIELCNHNRNSDFPYQPNEFSEKTCNYIDEKEFELQRWL